MSPTLILKIWKGRRYTLDERAVRFSDMPCAPFLRRDILGIIAVLVGVDTHGKILGIEILHHAETPGLGNRIEDKSWKDTFIGLGKDSNIAVKKDGGDIDEFSGATISPRAVCEAVNSALDFLGRYAVEAN